MGKGGEKNVNPGDQEGAAAGAKVRLVVAARVAEQGHRISIRKPERRGRYRESGPIIRLYASSFLSSFMSSCAASCGSVASLVATDSERRRVSVGHMSNRRDTGSLHRYHI